MRKKSDGHFSKKETKSVQDHLSDSTGRGKEQRGPYGLGGQRPRGPSRPLSRRRGAVPRPPGPPHPSRRSARGNPSPSARQRGRQPTNPVGLRGSPQAAPLPRSTRASPAASLLQSKQTPQPGSDFTSAAAAGPASRSVCAALRGHQRAHERQRETPPPNPRLPTTKFLSPKLHTCACAKAFPPYPCDRGERWECCHVFLGKLEWSWASVPTRAHSSRMMGCSEWGR